MDKQRRTSRRLPAVFILMTILAAAAPARAMAADPDRGRLLHDQRCVSCHDTRVYKRDSKVARNYDEIRVQVVRWETNVGLKWNDNDIDSVATYLAQTFYKVPCPVC